MEIDLPTYCIPIHVPIYTDGSQSFVISEWYRALKLLQDSFAGHFDRFILIAPRLPAENAPVLLEPIGLDDGFDPRPSIPFTGSKRGYWLGGERKRWRADVTKALDESDLAHTGMSDLYRPLSRDALEIALRRDMTTVFFVDTDIVSQIQALLAAGMMRRGPDRSVYLWYYERVLRSVVARADVSFLKGSTLFNLYGPDAKNPKLFHDTSYQSDEIVAEDVIVGRVTDRAPDAPLKLVYCGRLVARKGCDRSIEIVAKARALGANVTFDLIGDGPERTALEAQVGQHDLGDVVRFLGEKPYGPDLLRELADYDGLLFTPMAEDTPRMIFDGYAAGLPLLGADIPYVCERHIEENATLLLPQDNPTAAAEAVVALAADPERLATLCEAALAAARDNATDVWYGRRAAWTLEAHRERVSPSV